MKNYNQLYKTILQDVNKIVKQHLNEMNSLNNITNPLVINGKVKLIMLYNPKGLDSNLSLTTGLNKVCILYQSTNPKVTYMCINGGVQFNDGLEWRFPTDVPLKNVKWKFEPDIKLDYGYRGTIGTKPIVNTIVKSCEIPISKFKKFINDKSITIKSHYSYATATLQDIIKEWKDSNIL